MALARNLRQARLLQVGDVLAQFPLLLCLRMCELRTDMQTFFPPPVLPAEAKSPAPRVCRRSGKSGTSHERARHPGKESSDLSQAGADNLDIQLSKHAAHTHTFLSP